MSRASLATVKPDGLNALVEQVAFLTRREAIIAAGALDNRVLLAGLGSYESSIWHIGRSAADPDYKNPYFD